jgi:hypothetical protein
MNYFSRNPPFFRSPRQGYVMIVALILMALLAVLGTSTLNIAGVDYQIAARNRQHMLVLNTANAGNVHARNLLQTEKPENEGFTSSGLEDTAVGDYIEQSDGETEYEGLAYAHNLGVYSVDAIYHRCGNPPPGYSTEQGSTGFRSDYWEMESTGKMTNTGYTNLNATEAITSSMIRIVVRGACKVR